VKRETKVDIVRDMPPLRGAAARQLHSLDSLSLTHTFCVWPSQAPSCSRQCWRTQLACNRATSSRVFWWQAW
jgi:hypothetical protein